MRDVMTTEQAPIEVSGLSEVGSFSIAASGKAFKILIDGLYSDKPRAIVRELCTNAFDSHVMAGIIERPFKVHLPTRWEPDFSVRDYGISLTHQDVMGLYTTIFKSTKDGDNKNVGKFGLGSKVPFAYTDSFAVTAVLNGEKRSYNAFIDSDGIPKIALFSREETDEEQGVEVSFPVRQADIAAFQTSFKRVMLGFDCWPIHNLEDFQPTLNEVASGAGWRILKRDYALGLNGAFVRQGCVLYPLDQAALAASGKESVALGTLAGEAIIIDMPIGTVEITPSRETISYDAATIANIIDRLDGMLTEVTDSILARLKSAKTRWEATKARRQLLESIDNYALKLHVSKFVKFNGRDLFDQIRITDKQHAVLKRHGVDLNTLHRPGKQRRGAIARMALAGRYEMSFGDVLPTFIYWTGDAPTHLGYRLAAANRAIAGEVMALPRFTPGSRAEKFLIAALGRPDEALKFRNIEEFTFDKPDYQKTLATLKIWGGRSFEDRHAAPDVDQENVYFCHTFRNEPKRGEREISSGTVGSLWSQLIRHNIIAADSVLVGIPASRKDIAKSIPDAWNDFFETAAELVLERFDATKAAQAQAASTIVHEEDAAKWLDLFERIGAGDDFSQSLFWHARREALPFTDAGDGQLHLVLKGLLSDLVPYSKMNELMEGFDPAARLREFWGVIRPLRSAYPLIQSMIKATSRWNKLSLDDKGFEHLRDYIALCDAREGAERASDF